MSRRTLGRDVSPAWQVHTDKFDPHPALDERLRVVYGSRVDHYNANALKIGRTPMPPGKSSRFINHVTLTSHNGSTTELVEKGVEGDSPELSFWSEAGAGEPVLEGSSFRAVRPGEIVRCGPLSVLYFPYLRALDRDRQVLRQDFKANATAIVEGVAEFNGRNTLLSGESGGIAGHLLSAPRPTVVEIQRRMDVDIEVARDLLRSFNRVQDMWQEIEGAYADLPRCLSHNDISPGNAVYVDNKATFIDFGLAGPAPVGSDLHTVLRWSGKALYNPSYAEALLNSYVAALRLHYAAVQTADVRLAAWTTFYLRYTNLKFSSARYERTFRLALDRMTSLIGQLGDGPPGPSGSTHER